MQTQKIKMLRGSLIAFALILSGYELIQRNEPVRAADVLPTYTDIAKNIVQPKCLSCHSEAVASGGRVLTTYEGVLKEVVPGDPSNSNLYNQVQSGRMPQGGVKLSDSEIAAIQEWISSGAKDD